MATLEIIRTAVNAYKNKWKQLLPLVLAGCLLILLNDFFLNMADVGLDTLYLHIAGNVLKLPNLGAVFYELTLRDILLSCLKLAIRYILFPIFIVLPIITVFSLPEFSAHILWNNIKRHGKNLLLLNLLFLAATQATQLFSGIFSSAYLLDIFSHEPLLELLVIFIQFVAKGWLIFLTLLLSYLRPISAIVTLDRSLSARQSLVASFGFLKAKALSKIWNFIKIQLIFSIPILFVFLIYTILGISPFLHNAWIEVVQLLVLPPELGACILFYKYQLS